MASRRLLARRLPGTLSLRPLPRAAPCPISKRLPTPESEPNQRRWPCRRSGKPEPDGGQWACRKPRDPWHSGESNPRTHASRPQEAPPHRAGPEPALCLPHQHRSTRPRWGPSGGSVPKRRRYADLNREAVRVRCPAEPPRRPLHRALRPGRHDLRVPTEPHRSNCSPCARGTGPRQHRSKSRDLGFPLNAGVAHRNPAQHRAPRVPSGDKGPGRGGPEQGPPRDQPPPIPPAPSSAPRHPVRTRRRVRATRGSRIRSPRRPPRRPCPGSLPTRSLGVRDAGGHPHSSARCCERVQVHRQFGNQSIENHPPLSLAPNRETTVYLKKEKRG